VSDRLDELLGHLRETEVPLDDLKRTRILHGIERALRGEDEEQVVPRRRRAPWIATALVLAAAAAAVLLWPRPEVMPTAILRPFVYAGGAPSVDLLTQGQDRLELPAGAVVRAELGETGRLTLRGPARLSVESGGDTIELRLDEGALAVDFDATAGRRLLVHAPDGTTEVTGTLFAVEVSGGRSRVAVRRGAVKVRTAERVQRVGAGEAWRPGDATVLAVDEAIVARLVDHDDSVLPPKGEWGIVVVGGADTEVTQDHRSVGPAPVAARLPAGRAGLEIAGTEVVADVARGKTTAVSASARAVERPPPVVPPEPVAVPTPVRVPRAPRAPVAAAPVEVPAPPPPAAPVAPTPSPEPTARELYADAERAMRDRKPQAARDALHRLVERHPADPLADAAHYELGRLAFSAGEWSAAETYLARDPRDPALVEPVAYLRCRVAVARHAPDAPARLAGFRRAFPRSPHDAEILALLAAARHREGCAAAAPLLDEYLARYPRGPFAKEAVSARARCD
jgi:FecR protein